MVHGVLAEQAGWITDVLDNSQQVLAETGRLLINWALHVIGRQKGPSSVYWLTDPWEWLILEQSNVSNHSAVFAAGVEF